MYSFITGNVVEKKENLIILENNGIGYEILCSNQTLSSVGNVGQSAKIFTYLHVREDAFVLFGFASIEEKNIFIDLISVSGIGPKMAIGILSGVSVKNLVNAIATGDVLLISSFKGIGKKTAERLIIEMKGKLGKFDLNSDVNNLYSFETDSQTEAINLLVNIGLSKLEAQQIVKQVSKSTDTTEEIITKSLQNKK